MKTKKVKRHRGWADVGSHGGIFVFANGNYPGMYHIYNEQITPGLVEVSITPLIKRKKKTT